VREQPVRFLRHFADAEIRPLQQHRRHRQAVADVTRRAARQRKQHPPVVIPDLRQHALVVCEEASGLGQT
jgi:hypothetical protein